MSTQPIDDGGAVYARPCTLYRDGEVATPGQKGVSYRADVAKDCLVAMLSRTDVISCTREELVGEAIQIADALIAALKGGPR